MATLVNFFVLMWTAVLAEGITTHSVTGCSDRVLLNCSITEMIHVERITYYNGTDCNQAVTDLQVCGQPLTGSDTGLIPMCNGKPTCNEILYYSYCPGSRAARVDYRCIPGNNVTDMCDTFIVENTNRIFLSTPNYPSPPTFTDISPCRCSIRGSSITSIQILELVLTSAPDGTKSSLEINYGDVTYKTESFSDTSSRRVYNIRLSATSTRAWITLNHNSINTQYLWIEIQGISIQLRCNTLQTTVNSSKRTVTPSTFPPPQDRTSLISTAPTTGITRATSGGQQPEETTSSFTSTDTQPVSPSNCKCSERCDSNKDTTINILAVLLSLCLLMMCIAAIIIIVLLRKGKIAWVKTSPQVERESNPYSGLDLNQRVAGPAGNLRSPEEEGERNPYSGLELNQRVAGPAGTYQELNTRNSTPQYNNVSQNTHNDYYNLN